MAKILVEVRTLDPDNKIENHVDLVNDSIHQSFIVDDSVVFKDSPSSQIGTTEILIQEQMVYKLLNKTGMDKRYPYILIKIIQDENDTYTQKLKCVCSDGDIDIFDSFIIFNSECYSVIDNKINDRIILSFRDMSMIVTISTQNSVTDKLVENDKYYIHSILTRRDNNTIVMMRRPAYCIIDKNNCASYSKDNDIITQYAMNNSHVVALVSSHGTCNSILHIKSGLDTLIIADQIVITDYMAKLYRNDLLICEYNLLNEDIKLTVTVVKNKY